MSLTNEVRLLGNVGADPKISTMQNGKKKASFSLATSKRWRDKQTGENTEKTQWHNVVVWNESLVEVIEKYVKKGKKILVRGELETRKWQDDHGVERYVTEVVLNPYDGELQLLGGKENGEGTQAASQNNDNGQGGNNTAARNVIDDDIPF